MAKCGRKQRDGAVDLYIKYERCAADVIRERGYPGKGSLLSWYADRLEEECNRRSLQSRGTLQALQRRAETGRGGPLPRIQQAARPHPHADARLSQKQDAAHGVDRRAGSRPAQDAESCGMIGGDGINDESGKTSPVPRRLRIFFMHDCIMCQIYAMYKFV